MTEEIKMLEKEIEKLAKELNIEEKHIERIFDGSYSSISLTKKSKEKRVFLISHLSHKIDGKVQNPSLKSTRDDNFEVIQKMEKFMRLVKLYMFVRKVKVAEIRVKGMLAFIQGGT